MTETVRYAVSELDIMSSSSKNDPFCMVR